MPQKHQRMHGQVDARMTMTSSAVSFPSLFVVAVVAAVSCRCVESQESFRASGRCEESVGWKSCGNASDFKNSHVTCRYSSKYDKSKVTPTSIFNSCAKPDDLQLTLNKDGFRLNITWRLAGDMTIKQVTGFLVTTSNWSIEGPITVDESVILFNISGNAHLDESDLKKLSEIPFVYDCQVVHPKAMYKVTVKTLPSTETGSSSSLLMVTNELPKINYNETCNNQWVAFMYATLAPSQADVCFRSAPAMLRMNKYILHVMTPEQYSGQKWRTPENLEDINLTSLEKDGEIICRNFTLKPGNYVAMLQPNIFCNCGNASEVCHHTYMNFEMKSEFPAQE